METVTWGFGGSTSVIGEDGDEEGDDKEDDAIIMARLGTGGVVGHSSNFAWWVGSYGGCLLLGFAYLGISSHGSWWRPYPFLSSLEGGQDSLWGFLGLLQLVWCFASLIVVGFGGSITVWLLLGLVFCKPGGCKVWWVYHHPTTIGFLIF